MNCEPGDIAIVVGRATTIANNHTGETLDLPPRGTVVEVTACRSDPEVTGGIFCQLKPLVIRITFADGKVFYGTLDGVADAVLRPIRDNPGQDETLMWKDVPSSIKEVV